MHDARETPESLVRQTPDQHHSLAKGAKHLGIERSDGVRAGETHVCEEHAAVEAACQRAQAQGEHRYQSSGEVIFTDSSVVAPQGLGPGVDQILMTGLRTARSRQQKPLEGMGSPPLNLSESQ